MPEYLSPGVYVEELPPARRSIQGVATSTTAFVGPTRSAPTGGASTVLTSVVEYEREYGDGAEMQLADGTGVPNYMWHAARAFFENGGQRLHVAVATRAAEFAAALVRLEHVPEISLVAAPGATFAYQRGYGDDADAIIQALLAHAERTGRFAVVDAGDAQSLTDVRAMRRSFDSAFGALYYPWVRIADPASGRDLLLPPSGFVAGIYARVDTARGVHTAAAGEVVAAAGLDVDVSQRDQEILNPEGINCLRTFPDRGVVLWGNRTLSSRSEWKYVNLRRYLLYLERSIFHGTQWAVFEPNGEPLWDALRQTIDDFLLNEWKIGGLLGNKPEEAFFVKCDRTTMTQDDIDNGRLICLVGVAPLRPAEFVIFRIGQWTRDRTP